MIRRWRRPNLSPVRVYSIELGADEPTFELMARASLGPRGELRWAFATPGDESFLTEFGFRTPDDVRRQFSVSSMITTDGPPADPRRIRPPRRRARRVRHNDAAVDDALAVDHLDLARRSFNRDGSVDVYDELGKLVEHLPPPAAMEPRGSIDPR